MEKPFARRLKKHMDDVLAGRPQDEFRWSEIEALGHHDKRDATHRHRLRDLVQNILISTTMRNSALRGLNTQQREIVRQMLLARISPSSKSSARLREKTIKIAGAEKYLEIVATIDELVRIIAQTSV